MLSALEYPISEFVVEYSTPRDDLPPVESLETLRIPLTIKDGFYDSVLVEGEGVTIEVGRLPEGAILTSEAVQEVLNAIVKYLNEEDVHSVYVSPDRFQIDPRNGRDRRRAGDTTLKIDIHVGQIQDIQSVAKGTRVGSDKPIDHPKHSPIIKYSPLRPIEDVSEPFLFRKKKLDDYLRRLNRHPGRRVDATIASSGTPGEIDLHYLVTENKPWIAYAQVANTGTASVGEWQTRVGFNHYQVFGRDDIAAVDYVVADPKLSYTGVVSYSVPLVFPDYLKANVYGIFSTFTGDQFAQNTLLTFGGTSKQAGFEIRTSPFSTWGFAHDFFVGFKYDDMEVEQQIADLEPTIGRDQIRYGNLGYSFSRNTRKMMTNVTVTGSWNVNPVDPDAIDSLGRLFADPSWVKLNWDINQSFYLEPVFNSNKWKDLDTWESSTLAHEISFTTRGQYIVSENRVIPAAQFVMGGIYSVRGYPENVAAADHGWYIQSEYRLHIPRLFKPYSAFAKDEQPELLWDRWNVRPPRPLTNPDWDLIFRLFTDFGQTKNQEVNLEDDPDNPNNGSIPIFETDQTVWGAGGGLELYILNNLRIRGDLGVVLDSLDEFDASTGGRQPIADAQRGDMRGHVVVTLSY